MERPGGRGFKQSRETNHTTAWKPGPLYNRLNTLSGCDPPGREVTQRIIAEDQGGEARRQGVQAVQRQGIQVVTGK